jgi:hypothetical protein
MSSRRAVLIVALAAMLGCTASFRTQDGGAIAPTGVSGGRMNSIYISDRGGPITRLGIFAFGLLAAMGATHSESTSTTTDHGSYVEVETTTTTTVDPVAAQNAAEIMGAAMDTSQNFGGLTGGLEIAARDLGGDTSGWMYDMGYSAAETSKHSHWGVRGSAKFAIGSMTMHDRMMSAWSPAANMIVTQKGDASYGFCGTFLRAGVTYWLPVSHKNVAMLEGFVEADLNWLTLVDSTETDGFDDQSHPSPWSAGVRFTAFKTLYAEVKVLWSAMNSEHTSSGFEVGFAF